VRDIEDAFKDDSGRLLLSRPGVVARREDIAHALHRPALPGAHLVRLNLMLGRDLLDHLVAPQRLQRYPGLELRRQPAPFPHRVLLLYKAEYTLSACPIFRDNLSRMLDQRLPPASTP
jgi:hypothetical protein